MGLKVSWKDGYPIPSYRRICRQTLYYGGGCQGQTEDEVIESLGGPRIIARTIVDAAS